MRYGNFMFADGGILTDIDNLIKSNGVLYYSKYVDENLEYTLEDYKRDLQEQEEFDLLKNEREVKERYEEIMKGREFSNEFYDEKLDANNDELKTLIAKCDKKTLDEYFKARKEDYQNKTSQNVDDKKLFSYQVKATIEAERMSKTIFKEL